MFNPLVDSFESLTDTQVEDATRDLSRKYFQSRNPQIQQQIAVLLEMYKEELRARTAKRALEAQQNNDSDLDNLINVS
jgi:hypothetical protein